MERQVFDIEAVNHQLMNDESFLVFLGIIEKPSEYMEVTEELEYLLDDTSLAEEDL